MIIDLAWLVGWIIVAVGAYLGGLPVILLAIGSFISHVAAGFAMKGEAEKETS